MWYEGTYHQFTSGTKVKVIYKDQSQISGSCFSKDGCFWGISVSQTHLVSLDTESFGKASLATVVSYKMKCKFLSLI